MKRWLAFLLLLHLALLTPASAAPPLIVQDFESPAAAPKVWVVNIPNQNAVVQISAEHPHAGASCLKLHYHFVATGGFQYLGLPNTVELAGPVRELHFWLFGNDSHCSYGVQVTDAGGETHQYGKNSGQGGIIDFHGWKEIIIDLTTGHETWGGDKNGKLDYPLKGITLTVAQPTEDGQALAQEGDLFFDTLSVTTGPAALMLPIAVTSPEYGSEIQGDTRIDVSAPGFTNVTAKCWRAEPGTGTDSTVAAISLDPAGRGDFVFPGNAYPHGPITVRLHGENGAHRDNCYLQLYNRGGTSWFEGMPQEAPPPARGLALVFADDFTTLPTISSTDSHATYYDHKPGGGDFSSLPFSGFHSAANPFAQMDTYLRIRASEKTRSAGLLSSLHPDGTGVKASVPCYFECRFLAPNAIGSWPAFWLLSDWDPARGHNDPCDELDIIEAYGGEGPRAPNAFDTFCITPHAWNQGEPGKALETRAQSEVRSPVSMKKTGIPSAWFESVHTYGCLVTATDTIYYCDNHEIARHHTLPVSRSRPFYFMINLATGGGWPVDLSRYHGQVDMYVDYVRVYAEKH